MISKKSRIFTLLMVFSAILAFWGSSFQPVSGQTPEPPRICSRPFQPVAVALTDLGGAEYIRMDGKPTGFTGGLYADGSNTRPAQHEAAGLALADQIQPLTVDGKLDGEKGKIVFISIGMSNTAIEFEAFNRLAKQNAQFNQQVILFNGALSGLTSEKWIDPQAIGWQQLEGKISKYSFSPLQVQAAWVKLTQTGGGEFPQKAQALQADLEVIVQHLKQKFPNLKLVFLSSRTRSYTYWRGLSPEPLAYETGFAVKWLIEKQIAGDAALNYDPQKGEVKAPFLSWGPYLWADGENPRKDGFLWLAGDMRADCTHPSEQGAEKVAQLMWDFFSTDTLARGWFLSQGVKAVPTITRAINEPPTASLPPPAETPKSSMEITSVPSTSTPLYPTEKFLVVESTDESTNRGMTPFNLIEGGLILLGGVLVVSVLLSRRRRKKPVE